MASQDNIALREPYFKSATLINDPVFCFDDRESAQPLYVKVPGGLIFLVCHQALLRYLNDQPLNADIDSLTRDLILETKDAGLNFGIHNHGSGCAYLNFRRDVLAHIADNGQAVIEQVSKLSPEIYDDALAQKIISSIKKLATNNDFFSTSPDDIFKTASELGSPTMDVVGEHHPDSVALINSRSDETLDTTAALKAGLPAYCFDNWAFLDATSQLESFTDFPEQQRQLASLIDTIGTTSYLKVKEVYVRQ